MRKIITIHDAFYTQKNELVFAGTNSDIDQLPIESLKMLIGTEVKIINQLEKLEQIVNVTDIEISQSIIGQKNFFLKINGWVGVENLAINADIYSER